jgi:hypothetical protein
LSHLHSKSLSFSASGSSIVGLEFTVGLGFVAGLEFVVGLEFVAGLEFGWLGMCFLLACFLRQRLPEP